MWKNSDFYYPEVESQFRPLTVWSRRLPRFIHPYARPPDIPHYARGDMSMMNVPFRIPRIPLDIVTPHAGSAPTPPLRPVRTSNHVPSLYKDFSAPTRPTPISIIVKTSAVKCLIEWKPPAITKTVKYKYKLEVWEGVRCDTHEFPAHILSFKLKTTPGTVYKLELSARDANNAVIAVGTTCIKAVFSPEEMQTLYRKSLDFVGTIMHCFRYLYRCKPKVYYDDIQFHRGGVMEKYMKDNNGQAASSINGAISGLFFSARLLPDGSLPTHSPFGNIRMLVPAMTLLDPSRVNMYFCDFYCNYITHYVTVVICEKRSDTDLFCMQRLIKLAPDSNPFLRVVFRSQMFEPEFWVNKNVWVEIYYTENVPLSWGRFDTIIATGAGTSRVGGLPHNKQCQLCNLYTHKAGSALAKIASGKLNSTFELLLRLEKQRLGCENISESADLIETICSLVDSVVEQNSHDFETANEKEGKDEDNDKKLVSPGESLKRLDQEVASDEMLPVLNHFKKVVNELESGILNFERQLKEEKLNRMTKKLIFAMS